MGRALSPHVGKIMIKDIVANLSLRDSPDVAVHFAVSVAAAFNAHVAGSAFL